MLIGIISDTHIPDRASKIPDKVFEVFKDVDLILHAGDIVDLSVIEQLEEIAPVYAVKGNMDFDSDLNESEIIEVEDVKIGLNHGYIYPRGDTQQLSYIAQELGVKILVSGHTHQANIQQIGDLLLLNPGSPTNPRLSNPTVMLLEISGSNVEADIIKIGAPVCQSLDFSRFKH